MKEQNKNIEVPTQVVVDLEMVRKGGKYNMFDSQGVIYELYQQGCYETVNWLFDENWREGSYHSQADKDKYAAALRALSESKLIAEILS